MTIVVYSECPLALPDGRGSRRTGQGDHAGYLELTAHTGTVEAVAFSPDGRLLASGLRR